VSAAQHAGLIQRLLCGLSDLLAFLFDDAMILPAFPPQAKPTGGWRGGGRSWR
jgi:hypothetical protein